MRAQHARDLLGDEVEDLLGARLGCDGYAARWSAACSSSCRLRSVTSNDDEELVLAARDEPAFVEMQVGLASELPLLRLELTG